MGWPSYVVAIDAGVPGMFSSMAGTNPPETPPMKMELSKAIPAEGSIPYVSGKSKAMASVLVNPGIAPKINPRNTPPTMRNSVFHDEMI
jgi:hypothetical protein